jgi:hypothetical protein
MMAMTTNSSTNVNPAWCARRPPAFPEIMETTPGQWAGETRNNDEKTGRKEPNEMSRTKTSQTKTNGDSEDAISQSAR